MSQPEYIGRFAPSPTGPLHLGSLATALGSWLDARMHQGRWLVRIEDIDTERCKPEWSEEILACLKAHGLVWHDEPWVQSRRHAAYQAALSKLAEQGATYPCACTRKDLEQANQHRAPGQHRIYPGTCRHGMPHGKHARTVRFICPNQAVHWHDHRRGLNTDHLPSTSGDFVLVRGDGHWAYHLAVVVDDLQSGVNHIVRGEDLADTTARQVAVWQALGGKFLPRYWHLPVILAEDGQKLSKQTGAAALEHKQALGNLNKVWTHFGLPPMQARSVEEWLALAIQRWPQYRAAEASKTRGPGLV
ncbi:tRNA glutamyl-Q(34) synthetase GluQRS [Limnobacter sp.]|uniref:tRNA glutamyl-Q(34) synthetase GluQRS n=1 Tax=Limnobacter sp. TaxID=2003368 RepID=UPI0035195DAF